MKQKDKNTCIVVLAILMLCFYTNLHGLTPYGQYLFKNLVIEGATNVNLFHLSYQGNNFSYFSSSDTSAINKLKFNIPAKEFEANPEPMLKDFLDLINADEHPMINIAINEGFVSELHKDITNTKNKILVTLNGVSRTYYCQSEIDKSYYNEWYLSGDLKINLSDFEIAPPVKFFGLVKVKDEVSIQFNILLILDDLSQNIEFKH